MPFVRIKGNQVLLVHGARNPDTGAVEQETLFTFYTKAEIEAATGEHRQLFQGLLKQNHPAQHFDWGAVDAALRAHIDHVPDAAPSQQNTAALELRRALVDIVRVTWELDPTDLFSAHELVAAQKQEIGLIVEQLQWLLRAPPPADSEFNRDTPSLWRQAAKARAVPLSGWEQLDDLWDHCKYDEVQALAGLLAEAFPMFADAHNYLGLVAMEQGNLAGALQHFLDAEAVGRKQFPRRIAKSRYWSDHSTRPFLRALMHQVAAHNRLGAYANALEVCDRLERDYGQAITAETLRVPVLLNDGQWQQAAHFAQTVVGIYPENHFLIALAMLELRQLSRAHEHFVCGALQLPATAALLLGVRLPKTVVEEPRDHNHGVALLRQLRPYLGSHRKSLQVLKSLWLQPVVQGALQEAEQARLNWRAERGSDRTWYDLEQKSKTLEHARAVLARGGVGQVLG